MIAILVDHNIEGQATVLWGVMASEGWLDLLPLELFTFAEMELPFDSSDPVIWRFVQEKKMMSLTDNRNMKGENSLEQTIREENSPNAFPVITIGNVARLDEKTYREQCATRLLEISLDLEHYLGCGRIFIP